METTIKMITSEYDRTDSGRSWRSKPHTVKENEITLEQLDKITNDDTLRWFRRLGGSESVQRTYTKYGYLPYRCTSCSPSRDIKKVREFIFN